jgi:hypothetical protein
MSKQNLLSLALIFIALGIIVYLSITGADPTSYNPGFFSDDQGSTYFMDVTTRIAPFDHNGKQAVHADVFTCDANKTKFVGYLDRYKTEMKAWLDHPPADKSARIALMEQAAIHGVEIAAPHSNQWFDRDSPEAQKIIDNVRCPTGSQNNLTIAWP